MAGTFFHYDLQQESVVHHSKDTQFSPVLCFITKCDGSSKFHVRPVLLFLMLVTTSGIDSIEQEMRKGSLALITEVEMAKHQSGDRCQRLARFTSK